MSSVMFRHSLRVCKHFRKQRSVSRQALEQYEQQVKNTKKILPEVRYKSK